jgi:glycosyltransferase involved in cell wall biosynthesis
MSHYRFFFHPVRYTSFGLAVCEAMHVGLPIVALSVTEMPTVLQHGVSGYLDVYPERLMRHMARLLANPEEARRLGEGARAVARRRFNLDRFVADWDRTIAEWVALKGSSNPSARSRTSSHTGMVCAAE